MHNRGRGEFRTIVDQMTGREICDSALLRNPMYHVLAPRKATRVPTLIHAVADASTCRSARMDIVNGCILWALSEEEMVLGDRR